MQLRFADHILDVERRELRCGPDPVSLEPQVFDLLVYLLIHRDRVVSKDDLWKAVWGGRVVSEAALASRIAAARRAIGDSGEEQRLIRTVHGRGLRFVADVREEAAFAPYLSGTATDASAAPPPLPDWPSIAVLPFANLSGDSEQEYFSDGVADDIITELSRDHALFVISRNSSFTYRGRAVDLKQVGHELGVRYVVEGSVRRHAGRVRLNAQLIDTTNGTHVWADRYERDVEHIFAVQDEIAEAVATAIRPAVSDAERRRILRKSPDNLSAWEAYQRGLWHLSQAIPDDNEKARALFGQAVDIDPGFASAYVALSLTYVRDAMYYGVLSYQDAGRLAENAVRRGLSIDPNDADAHAALGLVISLMVRDLDAVLRCGERAAALNRNCASAHYCRGGALIYTGRHAEGRAAVQLSLRLNPRDLFSAHAACLVVSSYYFARDYDATVVAAARCLTDYPTYHSPRRYLVAALGHAGRLQEGAAALREASLVASRTLDQLRYAPPTWWPLDYLEDVRAGLRKAGWQG